MKPGTARPKFPRWFPTNTRAQAIAEWLAFNIILDRALGVVPSPERWPYSDYKRPAVEAFLKRLEGVDLDAAMAGA